jgi:hypothetical protein
MKPEEMRDDIPKDVREALAAMFRQNTVWFGEAEKVMQTIRAKPKTVRLPAADLPRPLEEMPESGGVWTVEPAHPWGVRDLNRGGESARVAIDRGLAWATRKEAEQWLAHLKSWKNPRPGDDWTPHTPGDPMPCDGEAFVDVRFRDGDVVLSKTADCYDWSALLVDELYPCEITAWRYAREPEK